MNRGKWIIDIITLEKAKFIINTSGFQTMGVIQRRKPSENGSRLNGSMFELTNIRSCFLLNLIFWRSFIELGTAGNITKFIVANINEIHTKKDDVFLLQFCETKTQLRWKVTDGSSDRWENKGGKQVFIINSVIFTSKLIIFL